MLSASKGHLKTSGRGGSTEASEKDRQNIWQQHAGILGVLHLLYLLPWGKARLCPAHLPLSLTPPISLRMTQRPAEPRNFCRLAWQPFDPCSNEMQIEEGLGAGRKGPEASSFGFPRKASASAVPHKGLSGPDRLASWDCSHLLPGSLPANELTGATQEHR